MTQETIDWLRQRRNQDLHRLHGIAAEAAGTPGGMEITRLAMDQVTDIISTRKILDIAEKALAEGEDPRFAQIVAWLAYARSSAPGYLDTWAPDEVDLVGELRLLDQLELDDPQDHEPRR